MVSPIDNDALLPSSSRTTTIPANDFRCLRSAAATCHRHHVSAAATIALLPSCRHCCHCRRRAAAATAMLLPPPLPPPPPLSPPPRRRHRCRRGAYATAVALPPSCCIKKQAYPTLDLLWGRVLSCWYGRRRTGGGAESHLIIVYLFILPSKI